MRIILPSLSLAYSERGQGIPLLFIHGYPLNRHLWQPQLDSLADVARLIAIDLRGHNESPPEPGPYSMDFLAEDCLAFLDALNITQPIILCGLWGGYVALAFYRKFASRVAGLILVATRASADSPEAKAGRENTIATIRSQDNKSVIEAILLTTP